jgi:hypothetical protein
MIQASAKMAHQGLPVRRRSVAHPAGLSSHELDSEGPEDPFQPQAVATDEELPLWAEGPSEHLCSGERLFASAALELDRREAVSAPNYEVHLLCLRRGKRIA